MLTNKYRYSIYTDGSCQGNPGPGAYAVIIVDNKTKQTETTSRAYKETTNNRMELMGVIRALELIRKWDRADNPFVIYSDSQYVVKVAKNEWTRKKNFDLWDKFDDLSDGLDFDIRWVRGHDGNKYNEMCDKMAKKAIKEQKRHADEVIPETKNKPDKKKHPEKKGLYDDILDVPDGMDQIPTAKNLDAYVSKYHVNKSCGAAIRDFYKKKNHRFKDYMLLKVGGLDHWSMKKTDELKAVLDMDVVRVIEKNLVVPTMQASCMKWVCRGLTITDALRKVLVDDEVSTSCTPK